MVIVRDRVAREAVRSRCVPFGRSGRLILAALLLASSGMAGAAPARSEPRTPALAELVETADLSSLAASRDGRLVAFRTDRPSIDRNSYDLMWSILDVETGTVVPIGGGGAPIIADPGYLVAERPTWSPDGRWIY